MRKLNRLLPVVCLLFITTGIFAQKFNRDNYLDYLPSQPQIISQTKASEAHHLYGDPSNLNYVDEDPVDGIDDHRKGRLDTLAAMFSPVMRKNNFSTPQDLEKMLRARLDKKHNKIRYDQRGLLFVDTWDLTTTESERVPSQSYAIDLGLLDQPLDDNHDTKLKELLLEFHPDSSTAQKIDPNHHQQKILFFDFPGTGEKNWKQIYQHVSSRDSKIYAHFFIHQDPNAKTPAQYELVIQYWFFSPFNDGGNNHEGDWEHINVSITTVDKATTSDGKGELLTEQDIQNILTHPFHTIKDSLIIKRIDYYFHHFVTTLDYQSLDFLQDQKLFNSALKRHDEKKLFRNWIHQQIYNRIHLIKDTLNTHPIAYIGADNMGMDQILALPGGRNQNSHGTYPFPGVWKSIGPIGATEKIHGEEKYQFLLPPIKGERFISRLNKDRMETHYEAVKNPDFVTFTKDEIIIIPDWECVIEKAITNSEVRRKWAWLILPIRFGFPVADSPGAGAFKHTDLGNAAPVGPAYNSGWNRVGACRGYDEYDPHVLPTQFLFGLQDNFINNWGCFNLTWPTFKTLPVINLIWSLTGARFEFNPKFFPKEAVPFRFASLVYRTAYTIGDNDFANLLPQPNSSVIRSRFENEANLRIVDKSLKQEKFTSFVGFMFNTNLGRYASENSFSISTSKIKYKIQNDSDKALGEVNGDLKFYELMGSLKHCVLSGKILPFFRIGYGWNWYRVENMAVKGHSLKPAKTQWFHNPTFPYLPNSGHLGAGIELFAHQNADIQKIPVLEKLFFVGALDFGLRLEYTFHFHKLGKDAPVNDWVYRHEFGAGFVMGF